MALYPDTHEHRMDTCNDSVLHSQYRAERLLYPVVIVPLTVIGVVTNALMICVFMRVDYRPTKLLLKIMGIGNELFLFMFHVVYMSFNWRACPLYFKPVNANIVNVRVREEHLYFTILDHSVGNLVCFRLYINMLAQFLHFLWISYDHDAPFFRRGRVLCFVAALAAWCLIFNTVFALIIDHKGYDQINHLIYELVAVFLPNVALQPFLIYKLLHRRSLRRRNVVMTASSSCKILSKPESKVGSMRSPSSQFDFSMKSLTTSEPKLREPEASGSGHQPKWQTSTSPTHLPSRSPSPSVSQLPRRRSPLNLDVPGRKRQLSPTGSMEGMGYQSRRPSASSFRPNQSPRPRSLSIKPGSRVQLASGPPDHLGSSSRNWGSIKLIKIQALEHMLQKRVTDNNLALALSVLGAVQVLLIFPPDIAFLYAFLTVTRDTEALVSLLAVVTDICFILNAVHPFFVLLFLMPSVRLRLASFFHTNPVRNSLGARWHHNPISRWWGTAHEEGHVGGGDPSTTALPSLYTDMTITEQRASEKEESTVGKSDVTLQDRATTNTILTTTTTTTDLAEIIEKVRLFKPMVDLAQLSPPSRRGSMVTVVHTDTGLSSIGEGSNDEASTPRPPTATDTVDPPLSSSSSSDDDNSKDKNSGDETTTSGSSTSDESENEDKDTRRPTVRDDDRSKVKDTNTSKVKDANLSKVKDTATSKVKDANLSEVKDDEQGNVGQQDADGKVNTPGKTTKSHSICSTRSNRTSRSHSLGSTLREFDF